jgi:hypothetical protein
MTGMRLWISAIALFSAHIRTVQNSLPVRRFLYFREQGFRKPHGPKPACRLELEGLIPNPYVPP